MASYLSAATVAALFCATPVQAQMVQAPPRPGQQASAVAPRVTQTLTATTFVLAGVDDDIGTLTAGPSLNSGTGPAKTPAYTGVSDGGLTYSLGKSDRGISLAGHGFFAAYQHLSSGTAYGGDLAADAHSSLGRRMTVSGAHSVRNEPFVGFGGSSGAQSGALSNGLINSTSGAASSRSWSSATSAQLRREWTRRVETDLRYSFSQQKFGDRSRFNSSSHQATVAVDRSIGRRTGIGTDYTYQAQQYALTNGTTQSRVHHTVHGRFRADIARSRQRVTSFSLGTGVVYSQAVNVFTNTQYEAWNPSANASLTVGLGRSWSLGTSYQHTIASIAGIQPVRYLTHSLQASAGGSLNRRIEAVFSVNHSRGHGDPAPGSRNATYLTSTGTAQLRFGLTSQISAVLIYNHHQYRLDAAASAAAGIANQMDRNSVRVGVSWSAPIIGGPPKPRGAV